MHRHVDNAGQLLVMVAIAAVIAFLIAPIVVAVMMSFDGREYLGRFPPPDYSIHWYARFFSDTYYLTGLRTSLILASRVLACLVAVLNQLRSAGDRCLHRPLYRNLTSWVGDGVQAMQSDVVRSFHAIVDRESVEAPPTRCISHASRGLALRQSIGRLEPISGDNFGDR